MSAVLETPITMIDPPKSHSMSTSGMSTSATPADLVRYAMDSGADIERLEKLMAMQILWEEREARKAFVLAMAEFKRNPPEIFKTKVVSFNDTSYKHATLGGVTEPIINGLAQHGISHRWDTKQEGQTITVTCTLTHKLGHSESTSLTGMPDASGKKNPIQQMASAVSYLQRYTLLAATGIATKDMDEEDDDGRGSGAVDNTEMLTLWIDRANAAADTAALERIWGMGVADFNAAKDMAGYKAFKGAVATKGAQLKEAKQ